MNVAEELRKLAAQVEDAQKVKPFWVLKKWEGKTVLQHNSPDGSNDPCRRDAEYHYIYLEGGATRIQKLLDHLNKTNFEPTPKV